MTENQFKSMHVEAKSHLIDKYPYSTSLGTNFINTAVSMYVDGYKADRRKLRETYLQEQCNALRIRTQELEAENQRLRELIEKLTDEII